MLNFRKQNLQPGMEVILPPAKNMEEICTLAKTNKLIVFHNKSLPAHLEAKLYLADIKTKTVSQENLNDLMSLDGTDQVIFISKKLGLSGMKLPQKIAEQYNLFIEEPENRCVLDQLIAKVDRLGVERKLLKAFFTGKLPQPNWHLVVFDGFSTNRRLFMNCPYSHVSKRAQTLPPGYIWHIEPA